jgi:Na+-driven multidrug efflux pump
VAAGIDAEISSHASDYLNAQRLAIFMTSISESIVLYLTAMNKATGAMLLQMAVLPFHVIACWLLIPRYGIIGAGYAENITSTLTVILQVIYAGNTKAIRQAWFYPTS